MTRLFKKTLLAIARVKILGSIVGVVFEHLSGILPVNRRGQNAWAICFDHPVPITTFHLLAIPKRRIGTIIDLIDADNGEVLDGLLQSIELALYTHGGHFSISSNYGARQEVKQVHFHVLECGHPQNVNTQELSLDWSRRVGETEIKWHSACSIGRLDVDFAGTKQFPHPDDGHSRRALVGNLQLLLAPNRTFLSSMRGFSVIIKISKQESSEVQWPTTFSIYGDV